MNVDLKVNSILQTREDRRTLDELENEIPHLVKGILNLNKRNEIESFSKYVLPYIGIINRWNYDPVVYRYLKTSIDLARKIRKAFYERLDMLGGKNRFNLAKNKPQTILEELAEEYGLMDDYKNMMGLVNLETEKNKEVSDAKKDVNERPKIKKETEEKKESLEEKVEEVVISDMKKNAPEITGKSINLNTLLNYYKQSGLVGEENTAILQTLGAINKLCFGIESMSGTGKSYTVDFLIDLLQDEIYRFELGSEKSQIRGAVNDINKTSIIFIPELQKGMNNKFVVELLKNIGEKKDFNYKAYDVASNGNNVYTIEGDKGIIFTLATENTFKYDTEFSRRVFVLHTDISEQQTKEIVKFKGARRHVGGNGNAYLKEKEVDKLKKHLKDCLHFPQIRYENPFADFIAQTIPTSTVRARSYDDYYFNLIDSSAKFHCKNRIIDKDILFVNMQDIYAINQLYWKQFCKSLFRIPLVGEEIVDVFDRSNGTERKGRTYLSSQEVFETLKDKNNSLRYNIVKGNMEKLVDAGFLGKDDYDSRKPDYFKIGDLPIINNFDWGKCWQEGMSYMKTNYPELAELWAGDQVKGNKLAVYNPMDGKEVVLVKKV